MRTEGPSDVSTLLGTPFVSVPFSLFGQFSKLELQAEELVMLLQILAASQVQGKELLTPKELGDACNLSPDEAGACMERLVARGCLAIGEKQDEDGFSCNYFDLSPLWQRLQGPTQGPLVERTDTVSLFEAEFGRPLSGFECEQIRAWISRDGHPEWMVAEALREAVLANKYSFKYIDRVLFDWQRHRVRTRQELEQYRESYRERQKAREETAAGTTQPAKRSNRSADVAPRDERYAAFYQLFPDT
ncbi:DnaD domain-containing protein [Alicyclobacillus sp. ALC3]|uniref:DnaD domain-containing protein n=1 Tax=Alicyclobacillus sp. ALC3 TaxID=2796143 RepID=UPI0023786B46|nr:DnaD domain protein [Alicyclobacillus sp. ALC3]